MQHKDKTFLYMLYYIVHHKLCYELRCNSYNYYIFWSFQCSIGIKYLLSTIIAHLDSKFESYELPNINVYLSSYNQIKCTDRDLAFRDAVVSRCCTTTLVGDGIAVRRRARRGGRRERSMVAGRRGERR